MGNLKAVFIGLIAATAVLITFVVWREWSSTSSTPSQPATTAQQPAPATRPAAPARVAGTQQGPYVPLRPASRVQRRAPTRQPDWVFVGETQSEAGRNLRWQGVRPVRPRSPGRFDGRACTRAGYVRIGNELYQCGYW